MYLIDKTTNRIQKISQKTFSELAFSERNHLQEWLANCPTALGEELLIIQKEFDGFQDTNERLDLLALDKQGCLVIIENKLDDTGRDVTWQALKYASYCSSLSKEQIRAIYQSYLDKIGESQQATDKLTDFFGLEYDELILNKIQSQRLMLVAGKFRKEVTSTVLWLMNFKLRIQCFKVTPFEMANQYFLNIEQIIPVKDTEEYMISMANKVQEEQATQEKDIARHSFRMEFWKEVLARLKGKTSIFQNISPHKNHWLYSTAGIAKISYIFEVTKKGVSLGLLIAHKELADNKSLFDELIKNRTEIEHSFGNPLQWLRLDNKISSKVEYVLADVNVFDDTQREVIINFLVENIIKFEQALRKPIEKLKVTFKQKLTDNNEIGEIEGIEDIS